MQQNPDGIVTALIPPRLQDISIEPEAPPTRMFSPRYGKLSGTFNEPVSGSVQNQFARSTPSMVAVFPRASTIYDHIQPSDD